MARHDRLGHLALDLDADVVGEHQIRAAAPVALGERQHRRQRGRGRMREQSVDAVLRDRELRVVEVVGVDRDAVGERREARRHRSPLPITVLPPSAAKPSALRYLRVISPVCEAAPARASPMPSSTERLPRCATSAGRSCAFVPTMKPAT